MLVAAALDESFPVALREGVSFLASGAVPAGFRATRAGIEALREELALRPGGFPTLLGAPRTYDSIARRSSVDTKFGTFLHLVAAGSSAGVAVEIGIGAGIGSCYIASAPGCRRFVGLDGLEQAIDHAREHLEAIAPEVDVRLVLGDHAATLAPSLAGLGEPVDFAWVDGDHHYGQTTTALRTLTDYLAPGAVVAIDDIRYTPEMFQVWSALQQWRGFSDVVDVGRCAVGVWGPSTEPPRVWRLAEALNWPGKVDVLHYPDGVARP